MRPRWVLICPTCLGSGFAAGGTCSTCEGKKEIKQRRCPNSVSSGTMEEYFDAWRNMEQYSFQPVRGDLAEQPAFMQDVVDVITTVRGYIDRRKAEHAEKLKGLAT